MRWIDLESGHRKLYVLELGQYQMQRRQPRVLGGFSIKIIIFYQNINQQLSFIQIFFYNIFFIVTILVSVLTFLLLIPHLIHKLIPLHQYKLIKLLSTRTSPPGEPQHLVIVYV